MIKKLNFSEYPNSKPNPNPNRNFNPKPNPNPNPIKGCLYMKLYFPRIQESRIQESRIQLNIRNSETEIYNNFQWQYKIEMIDKWLKNY